MTGESRSCRHSTLAIRAQGCAACCSCASASTSKGQQTHLSPARPPCPRVPSAVQHAAPPGPPGCWRRKSRHPAGRQAGGQAGRQAAQAAQGSQTGWNCAACNPLIVQGRQGRPHIQCQHTATTTAAANAGAAVPLLLLRAWCWSPFTRRRYCPTLKCLVGWPSLQAASAGGSRHMRV
jgi:hypothetical protein